MPIARANARNKSGPVGSIPSKEPKPMPSGAAALKTINMVHARPEAMPPLRRTVARAMAMGSLWSSTPVRNGTSSAIRGSANGTPSTKACRHRLSRVAIGSGSPWCTWTCPCSMPRLNASSITCSRNPARSQTPMASPPSSYSSGSMWVTATPSRNAPPKLRRRRMPRWSGRMRSTTTPARSGTTKNNRARA